MFSKDVAEKIQAIHASQKANIAANGAEKASELAKSTAKHAQTAYLSMPIPSFCFFKDMPPEGGSVEQMPKMCVSANCSKFLYNFILS